MYYTFEGTVYGTEGDTGGLAAGSEVNYTFLVDLDRQGSFTYGAAGSTTTIVQTDNGGGDYFYVAYVSGTPIMERPETNPASTLVYNTGNFFNGRFNQLLASPTDLQLNYVSIVGAYWPENTGFVVGSVLQGMDYYSVGGSSAMVYSRVTLTSISPDAPSTSVPEPGTLLLLGTGVLGLAALSRRRQA